MVRWVRWVSRDYTFTRNSQQPQGNNCSSSHITELEVSLADISPPCLQDPVQWRVTSSTSTACTKRRMCQSRFSLLAFLTYKGQVQNAEKNTQFPQHFLFFLHDRLTVQVHILVFIAVMWAQPPIFGNKGQRLPVTWDKSTRKQKRNEFCRVFFGLSLSVGRRSRAWVIPSPPRLWEDEHGGCYNEDLVSCVFLINAHHNWASFNILRQEPHGDWHICTGYYIWWWCDVGSRHTGVLRLPGTLQKYFKGQEGDRCLRCGCFGWLRWFPVHGKTVW